MGVDSPQLSSRGGRGSAGGPQGSQGGGRLSASGSGTGVTPRGNNVGHGVSPLLANPQLRSALGGTSRLGRTSASGAAPAAGRVSASGGLPAARVSSNGSAAGSAAGSVTLPSRLVGQPRTSTAGVAVPQLSRLGTVPRTSMLGGPGSMSMRGSPFHEEELDEIISPDMRAAVRKTLAMNKLMAEHASNMKKYYTSRRKQQALAAALKTRGLEPKTPTGGSALTAEFLMATSPSALPELMTPSMAGQVGALVAAAHHLQTDGSLADVQFQPTSPAPILRLPRRLQHGGGGDDDDEGDGGGEGGMATSRGGRVKFLTHRSTHRATHRDAAGEDGDDSAAPDQLRRGGWGDGGEEGGWGQQDAVGGFSAVDEGGGAHDDEPGPDDLIWGDDDDGNANGDAGQGGLGGGDDNAGDDVDEEGLWDTPLLQPLAHVRPGLFAAAGGGAGPDAELADAQRQGRFEVGRQRGGQLPPSQPALEVHLPIPAESSFDSERSLTPSQVRAQICGERTAGVVLGGRLTMSNQRSDEEEFAPAPT